MCVCVRVRSAVCKFSIKLKCKYDTIIMHVEVALRRSIPSSHSFLMTFLPTLEIWLFFKPRRERRKNKEKSDKQKGEEMRKAAMELMGSMFLY